MNKKQIEDLIKELHEAILESIEASQAEDKAKLRSIKAQKRLSLAKDEVRSIKFN
jgi:hypothetical protein